MSWRDTQKGRQRKAITDAFIAKFPNPHEDLVLAIIADENFAHKSTFHVDPRMHAYSEGRRAVWLQIQHLLGLKPEDLDALARKAESLRNE